MTTIGFIGGTGDLGTGIAIHLAREYEILLGSRNLEKAKTSVATILKEKGRREYLEKNLKPSENRKVVETCKFILLTVPHDNSIRTVKELASYFAGDQVLVSAVAPVVKVGKEFRSTIDQESKSISQQISELVPASVKVATAFQSVPAHILFEEREISSDVLVTCDDLDTYQKVAEVISKIRGLRPLYLGSLNLSGEVERLTALVLNIAVRNKLKSPTPKFNSF